MTTKLAFQKILKEIIHTNEEERWIQTQVPRKE
jgi:hypothetical protein